MAPGAELIDVGKSPYHHPVSQTSIEQQLVDRAKQGMAVVRLKGGDPFVLGRGGEELQACLRAEVPVRVVPGVSSAVAVPGVAGIPVTHRGLAHSYTVVSGHVPPSSEELRALVALDSTIVILMGIANLCQIATGLIRAGLDASTPAAAIERGFSDRERSTFASLVELPERVRRLDIQSPAVIVIGTGRTARLAGPGGLCVGGSRLIRGQQLAIGMTVGAAGEDGGSGLRVDQLRGFRIGVTSDRRSGDLIAALERRGAHVVHAPSLKIAPHDQDRQLIGETQEVIKSRPELALVTTGYGMRRWFEVADAAGLGPELSAVLDGARILARGPKALGAVRAAGLEATTPGDRDTTAAMIDKIVDEGLTWRRVALQQHGYTDQVQLDRLREVSSSVMTVTPYRWATGSEREALQVDRARRLSSAGRGHLHQRSRRRRHPQRGVGNRSP